MNVIEKHERIKLYMDLTRSPRYSPEQYDNALNIACNDVLDDRYNNIKKKRPYSFESVQKVRDELWTLIKHDSFVIAGVNVISKASILALGDYKYGILWELFIDSGRYFCEPTSYAELRDIERNPFTRPQLSEPSRVYFIESESGITFKHGSDSFPTSAELDYIKVPNTIFYGNEYDSTHTFTVGDLLIALEETVYNGLTYVPGQYITIVLGFLSITSGTVVFGYTNTDFPEPVHDELCRRAAAILSGNVQDYQRKIAIDKDTNMQ